MIGFIIWIIGVVLCVKAVLEIMKWPVDGVKKLLVAIIILLTSWIGICVYYCSASRMQSLFIYKGKNEYIVIGLLSG